MVEIKNNTKLNQTVKSLLEQLGKESTLIVDCLSGDVSEFKSDVFDKPRVFCTCISDEEIIIETNKLRERYGIYVFIANEDFEFTEERISAWKKCSGASLNSQDKNKNMRPFNVKKGSQIYLGSCYSESLLTRVKEHCTQAMDVQKASLKLNNKNRKWVKPFLKVYCFPIKPIFSESELRVILPATEKFLHGKCQPIIGSSRT